MNDATTRGSIQRPRAARKTPNPLYQRLSNQSAMAAQQLRRHKTRKEPFRTQLWLIAGIQALLLIGAGYWSLHHTP